MKIYNLYHVLNIYIFLRLRIPANNATTPKPIKISGIITLSISMNIYQLRVIPDVPKITRMIPIIMFNISPPCFISCILNVYTSIICYKRIDPFLQPSCQVIYIFETNVYKYLTGNFTLNSNVAIQDYVFCFI